MPRRPNLEQLMEGLLSVFGVYRGRDPNVFPIPQPEALPIIETLADARSSEPQRPAHVHSSALTRRAKAQKPEVLRVL
jgi:hypothetical protein